MPCKPNDRVEIIRIANASPWRKFFERKNFEMPIVGTLRDIPRYYDGQKLWGYIKIELDDEVKKFYDLLLPNITIGRVMIKKLEE